MPYEDDRLRIQREQDNTFSVQIPGQWVGKGYLSPPSAMEAAEVILKGNADPEIAKLREERKELVDEVDELRKRLTILESAISSMDSEIAELESDSDLDELITIAKGSLWVFNATYEGYGSPTNIAITPYDKNRDGIVAHGEFEVTSGWCRYKMKEVSTTND